MIQVDKHIVDIAIWHNIMANRLGRRVMQLMAMIGGGEIDVTEGWYAYLRLMVELGEPLGVNEIEALIEANGKALGSLCAVRARAELPRRRAGECGGECMLNASDGPPCVVKGGCALLEGIGDGR